MILLQLGFGIILVAYWIIVPAAGIHSWAENVLEDVPDPTMTTFRNLNWSNLLVWAVFGLIFTGLYKVFLL